MHILHSFRAGVSMRMAPPLVAGTAPVRVAEDRSGRPAPCCERRSARRNGQPGLHPPLPTWDTDAIFGGAAATKGARSPRRASVVRPLRQTPSSDDEQASAQLSTSRLLSGRAGVSPHTRSSTATMGGPCCSEPAYARYCRGRASGRRHGPPVATRTGDFPTPRPTRCWSLTGQQRSPGAASGSRLASE